MQLLAKALLMGGLNKLAFQMAFLGWKSILLHIVLYL
jgi:hypothetical protein